MTLDEIWLALHWMAADLRPERPRLDWRTLENSDRPSMSIVGLWHDFTDIASPLEHADCRVSFDAQAAHHWTNTKPMHFPDEMLVLWDYILSNYSWREEQDKIAERESKMRSGHGG